MALNVLKITVAAFQINLVRAGWYISDDKLPDGGVTKYLKQITEVSCLLQCERDEECDNAIFRLRSKENRLGDCGFVKKDVPDKDGEMQTLQQNEPMSGYKRVRDDYFVIICDRNTYSLPTVIPQNNFT